MAESTVVTLLQLQTRIDAASERVAFARHWARSGPHDWGRR